MRLKRNNRGITLLNIYQNNPPIYKISDMFREKDFKSKKWFLLGLSMILTFLLIVFFILKFS